MKIVASFLATAIGQVIAYIGWMLVLGGGIDLANLRDFFEFESFLLTGWFALITWLLTVMPIVAFASAGSRMFRQPGATIAGTVLGVGAGLAWSAAMDILLSMPAGFPRDWLFLRYVSYQLVGFGVVVGITAFSLQSRMLALMSRLVAR